VLCTLRRCAVAMGDTDMTYINEEMVCRAIIREALALGWTVSVHDGEEWAVKRSDNTSEIFNAANSVDTCTLLFRKHGDRVGTVFLVWGNSPEELICDHSDNDVINALVNRVNA
jgi:hypothetical protein